MNADDVEMEFISVMGVLVPMEVTKGVSNEAKRFVAGDVWSGEENTNQGEASNDVEHTEIKCNLSKNVKTTNCPITAKAEDSELRSKEKPKNKKKRLKSKEKKQNQVHEEEENGEDTGSKEKMTEEDVDPEIAVSAAKKQGQCGESNSLGAEETAKVIADHDYPVQVEHRRKRKRSPTRSSTSELIVDSAGVEAMNQKERVEEKPGDPCLATPVELSAKSELRKQKSIGIQSKSDPVRTPTIQTVCRKEIKALSERTGQTQRKLKKSSIAKKPRKKSILTAAKAHESQSVEIQTRTVAGKSNSRNRTKMKKNIEAAAKAVPDGTSAAQIDDYSMESTNARAHSAITSWAQPFDTTVQISPAKSRKDKRSRPTDETRPPAAKQRKTTRPRITQTWKLDSDDEKQDNSEMQNSKSIKSLPLTSEDRVSNDRSDQDCCVYPECPQPEQSKSRCAKHNGRPRCSLPDCTKFAHSGGNCIAHGGGSRCTEEGCGRRARSQGKCYTHGGGILCSHPNCTTRAKTKGKCVAHGGGTVCSEKECDKLVTANGKCISHGGWVNCSQPGCEKRVQLRGKCMEHSECDFPESDQPTKRFRKTTIKSDGMSILPAKRHRILSVGKSTAVETVDKPAKRAKEAKKAATTTELDETTMALRSGQRIKLVTRSSTSGYGEFQSAEDALQMALKLSEIEY
ncbi:hypothetical protein PC120_g5990 [Phytophthora cactorum]|nr:hypothetical protein PC120_g5990 [Phytophthora cactorum]